MAEKKNPIARGVIWVVMLLLIVGLAGFGATSFGGSTRVVGTVGDTEIGLDRYARQLQQEIRAFEGQTGQNIPIAQAREMGIDRIVLQRLIALAALEDEADDLGLSVGDEEVARSIQDIQAFQGADGGFDREAYRFALQQNGLSVAQFEAQLRDETARSLLQGAVISGIQPPATFVDALYEYARETRDLTLVSFGPDALEGDLPEPTEEQLVEYYEANEDAFTLPRRKRITYVWLSPETMRETVEVSDEAVQNLYEQRTEQYDQPERRLVERLVFPDDEAARQAADAIEAGDTDFETLVQDRGLTLSDIDLGDVSRADLGPSADAVFALDDPGIAGPAPTPLGPALFRVNAILEAQQTPFEDVEDELRAEVALSAGRRAIEGRIEPIQDLLAGGATLEEIADETEFTLGETVWSPGEASEAGADIDAYAAFREAALDAEPGDFPELEELSDGGLFALRVEEILEPELQPLDAVRAEVEAGWEVEARRARLVEQAEAARDALSQGTAADQLGATVRRETELLRDAFLEGQPADLIELAFTLPEGDSTVVSGQDGAVLVRVDAVSVPGGATEEAVAIKEGVRTAAGQGIAQDITAAFTSALEAQKGISLNQSAVNAVLSQMN
ncbi:SurA N-terminal domain-containing protein [Palleronia abyssalis]|uniref:Parvulin-like PPIase n=1 Tax=Palleronia abyssalis TaxID=1501240 RepID=A0A2R8BQ58_9RHOB|nr:SurA N-terminal domain-containing protein [Palleronia abyssalis]SPJ22290.1 Peptidyl-prolyl cis-trans isomerase D [Palleronia abyssalis]